jgi:hypothetical protein
MKTWTTAIMPSVHYNIGDVSIVLHSDQFQDQDWMPCERKSQCKQKERLHDDVKLVQFQAKFCNNGKGSKTMITQVNM